MHEKAAMFLMKIPPIEEIGGRISHVIEQYRAGIIKEEVCLEYMLEEHAQYLKDFVYQKKLIIQQMY